MSGLKNWSVESDGTPQGTVIKDSEGKPVPFVQEFSIETDKETLVPVLKVVTIAPRVSVKIPKGFSYFDDHCPECKKTCRFELVSQRPLVAKCPNCGAKLGWGVVEKSGGE